nr:AAA family ATPase [Candidatus Accumulibacter phosphatis]
MRVDNFRCFAALDLELHSQLTVLVAENGQGKSTLLDAARIALWPFVSSFDLARNAFNDPGNAIAIDDVRLVKLDTGDMARQLPSRVQMTGDFGIGQERTWIRYRDKEAKLTKTKDDGDTGFMKQWAGAIQTQIRDPAKPTLGLPVFGYYGTGRLWAQKRLTETTKGQDDTLKTDFYVRTFAYRNCLDPASSYKHFKEWFTWAFESYREAQIKQLENRSTKSDVSAAQERILVVQQVIDIFLRPTTGWHTLEYSVSHEKSLVLHHDQHGTLEVDLLSDGIRSVLAMAGDIAYRCIKLNPHLGGNAARETQGVVMIDEVDMHLHPRWQQVVLDQLQQAFPLVQFIVTTHSPQVLSTVKRENIRVLGQDASGVAIAEPPLAMTYGEPSGDVMHSVMMVDPQPPVIEKADLQRLTAWVDQGNYLSAEAKQVMQSLTAALGEQHPQLQRLKRSIQRQEALKG